MSNKRDGKKSSTAAERAIDLLVPLVADGFVAQGEGECDLLGKPSVSRREDIHPLMNDLTVYVVILPVSAAMRPREFGKAVLLQLSEKMGMKPHIAHDIQSGGVAGNALNKVIDIHSRTFSMHGTKKDRGIQGRAESALLLAAMGVDNELRVPRSRKKIHSAPA